MPITPQIAAPGIVLDTNVVLDWMVFDDANTRPLARQIECRQLIWYASAAMRSELAATLHSPALLRQSFNSVRVLTLFDTWARPPAASTGRGTSHPLRCRDDSDQMFLDVAHATQASWLLSRDRALLALSRPALAYDCEILSPRAWCARLGDPTPPLPAPAAPAGA